MELSHSQRQAVRQITHESIVSALNPLKLIATQDDPEAMEQAGSFLVSILGFQGERMNGSVVMGCEPGFLQASCPGLRKGQKPSQQMLLDWIGELTNLIMGRVKNRLNEYEVSLSLSPPSISEGDYGIISSYSSRGPSETLLFQTENGDRVCFLIACDLDENVNFDSETSHNEDLKPGSGIVSLKSYHNGKSKNDDAGNIMNPQPVTRPDLEDDSTEGMEDYGEVDFEEERLSPVSGLGESQNALEDFDDTVLKDAHPEDLADPNSDLHSISVENLPPLKDKDNKSSKVEHETSSSVEKLKALGKERESALVNREKAAKGLDQQIISSFNLTSTGLVEVRFSAGLEFRLDPALIFEKGYKTFKMQGIEVSITASPSHFALSIAGVEILVDRKAA